MKIYRKKTKDGKHELFHIRVQVDGQRRRFLLGTDICIADVGRTRDKVHNARH